LESPGEQEKLKQENKMDSFKVPTIAESANQALEQIAAAKALRNLGRAQKLEALQAEFETLQPGTDPASPKSLERLAGQIREAHSELEGIGQEHIGSPEYQLAEACLRALIAEYNFQSDDLAARIV
jgi:hypothetical protein